MAGCMFTGNTAVYGGGIAKGSLTVTDCTFTGNTAARGGGIYGAALTISGSAFCENGPDHIYGSWDDAGGNSFCPLCDKTAGPVLEVPEAYPTIRSAINAACDASDD